jgi:nucleotide-binding universal stress UspA family protein
MNPPRPIRHIVVPHDFEDCSDAALDYAVTIAQRFGARITVLHAYEIPSLGAPEVLILATDWPKQFGVVARERLDAVVARVRGSGTQSGVQVDGELRQGTPWREIDAFAKERDVDLVILGSHGRRGLPRALIGSVAEKVVRTAPCPVLVVRGETEEG